MTAGTLHAVTSAEGPAALPRRNGELVFEAPWQSRAFGVAIALHDAGAIDYEVFRSHLIAEIARHEQGHDAGEEGRYYERWLDALEDVLVEQKLVSPTEIEARATEIAHAWDHDHEHGNGHEHGQTEHGGHA